MYTSHGILDGAGHTAKQTPTRGVANGGFAAPDGDISNYRADTAKPMYSLCYERRYAFSVLVWTTLSIHLPMREAQPKLSKYALREVR